MGLFRSNEQNAEEDRIEQEKLRGVPDKDLQTLSESQLIMLSLKIAMEAVGARDDVLIAELGRRSKPRLSFEYREQCDECLKFAASLPNGGKGHCPKCGATWGRAKDVGLNETP